MDRRAFLCTVGAVAAGAGVAGAAAPGPGAAGAAAPGVGAPGAGAAGAPSGSPDVAGSGPHPPGSPGQEIPPPLGAEVFRARIEAARARLRAGAGTAIFAEPGTNFRYLAGAGFGRSERLIALLVPAEGPATVVAPAFEVERVRRRIEVAEVRGWEEAEDPFDLVRALVREWGLPPGVWLVEPTTRFGMAERLRAALPTWRLENAGPLFRDLRIVKSPEELRRIEAAVAVTEAAMGATHARLEPGLTDREVARIFSEELSRRGARGGGLVQFGPASALPHGGTEGRELREGTAVLIDGGCSVDGYASDITRTIWFGGDPPDRFRTVFETVRRAQAAAIAAVGPGVECRELDRTARRIIREAGFGPYFTHRLGHGIGLDGHEAPYLVEGNALPLRPGMVFTVEPGIYLPGEWGVRLEDDVVVTEEGVRVLSHPVEGP